MDQSISKPNANIVIEEFFVCDGHFVSKIKKYKYSNLLDIINDLKYLLGIEPPGQTMVSGITLMTLLMIGFDTLARVKKASKPQGGQSGEYFTGFLRSKHCGFTPYQATKLWDLRNELLHSHELPNSSLGIYLINPNDSHQPLSYSRSNKAVTYYIRPMYSRFINAKRSLYKHITDNTSSTQKKYSRYIEEHGFYYSSKIVGI